MTGHSQHRRIRFTRGRIASDHLFQSCWRHLIRGSMGGILMLLMLVAARGVAAAGTPGTSAPSPAAQPTAPPTTPPTATQQSPPTAAPSSGTAGQLNPGTSLPTPPQGQTAPPSPTPPGAGIIMPLQPPTAEMPPVTAPAAGASPTAPAPTVPPTATRPANTPTQTMPATATSQPTSTPPGTPTNTPAVPPSSEEVAALANVVLLDDPGIGGNLAIVHAAARHFGEQARPDGLSWSGWCEMYIGNVMDEAGIARPRYATALLDAISGPLYRGHAPAGSVVYFDQRADPNGHVGVALGDGTMLSALQNGIVRSAYENWPSYLGWRPYGATVPPDETFMITPLLTTPDGDFPRMPAWP